MSAETWISVDVETSGPTPGTGSLLAIGACLVDRPEEGIELLVRPDPALPWSDEAEAVHRLWRERLAREGLEPGEAMERLAAWLERVVPAGARPVFVGFNAPFDWMFVAEYSWRHLRRNPFGISALDLKALYLGRHLGERIDVGRDVERPRPRALPGRPPAHARGARRCPRAGGDLPAHPGGRAAVGRVTGRR